MLRGTPCCPALLRAARRSAARRAARCAGLGNALPRAGQVGDGASMGSNEFATTWLFQTDLFAYSSGKLFKVPVQ